MNPRGIVLRVFFNRKNMFIEHKREVCVLAKFRECIKFSLPRRLSHMLVTRHDKKCYHVFTQCYGGSKSFNFDGDQWATVCWRDMLSICRLLHIAEINQTTHLCREPTGEILKMHGNFKSLELPVFCNMWHRIHWNIKI